MPLMRRRPVLRAAAVGGGAYMAGKHRAASQQREDDQDARISGLEDQQSYAEPQPSAAPQPYAAPPPAPPAPAAGIGDDVIQRLTQLGQLHEQGVLTDEEFTQQKAKLLGG